MVDRKYVDTILDTLSHCPQHIVGHVMQFGQERIQRVAVFYHPGIKASDPALVVKSEKALLQQDRGICDAPGMCEHSLCALGIWNLVVFRCLLRIHQTPIILHESEDSSCVGTFS